MVFNLGPIAGAITAVTHNQRMNNIDEKNKETTITNYTSESPMVLHQSVSLDSQKEILEETKNLLEEKKCKDSSCVSLYDILSLTHKKYIEYNEFRYNLQNKIHTLMKEGYYISMYFVNFDCSNMFLEISHAKYGGKVHFTKKDGDLIIVESSFLKDTDILGKCGEYISIFYDYCVVNKSYLGSDFKNIRSVNSNFLVNMSKDDVQIHSKRKHGCCDDGDFRLMSSAYDKEYTYYCNSNNITSIFRGKENEIFSRIFVKIEDCPIWMQEKLYQIRQNQLAEERRIEEQKILERQKIEEEIRQREIKKQKKLEFKRKIFPWMKK